MGDSATIEIWGAGTMRTFRPVWTAEELGLNYRHVPIGPRTGETQTEEYIRLNPKQKVPCLVYGELVLSESVAISRYLIARYGDKSTITAPERLETRAKEDEWVSYFYGELDETSLYVMRRHGALAPIYGEAPQAVASARTYAARHLSLIAAHLENRDFVVGGRFGLAERSGSMDLIYPTRDGYITAGVISDKEWVGMCRAIEREDLIDDERFSTARGRQCWANIRSIYLPGWDIRRKIGGSLSKTGSLSRERAHETGLSGNGRRRGHRRQRREEIRRRGLPRCLVPAHR